MTSNELSVSDALDRFRSGDESDEDVLLLAESYDFLTESNPATEEILRAEGFEILDDDAGTMWLLGVGRFELDVCVRLGVVMSLELEAMTIRRGNLTIGDVRMLLKALGAKT